MGIVVNKRKLLHRLLDEKKTVLLPAGVLLGLSCIVIASYILAGWMMRPVGDDYASLLTYHVSKSWTAALPEALLHGGGRYAQSFVSVIWYGALGEKGLRVTAFVSVLLFLGAVYTAVLAWQKCTKRQLNHKRALLLAIFSFLFYSLLSATFSWSRGHIDNTFQDFLWLPGFITYTLPVELTIILASGILLLKADLRKRPLVLGAIGILSIVIGTFSEIVPLIYAEVAFLAALYLLLAVRFDKQKILALLKESAAFICIGAGLFTGLALNYLSPATSSRRALFNENSSLTQLLDRAVHLTQDYFSTYVLNWNVILLAVVGGAAIGFMVFNWHGLQAKRRLIGHSAIATSFFAIMAPLSVFTCFFATLKGYGNTPYTYLMPRFEIIYNLWLLLFLISVGVLLAFLAAIIAKTKRLTLLVPLAHLLVAVALVAWIPYIMQKTANRVEVVAVFSTEWQQQNTELREAANDGDTSISVPVIDIGDAYDINCNAPSLENWLGVSKQYFYHIPHICSTNQ